MFVVATLILVSAGISVSIVQVIKKHMLPSSWQDGLYRALVSTVYSTSDVGLIAKSSLEILTASVASLVSSFSNVGGKKIWIAGDITSEGLAGFDVPGSLLVVVNANV
jgi:hypothetical protein